MRPKYIQMTKKLNYDYQHNHSYKGVLINFARTSDVREDPQEIDYCQNITCKRAQICASYAGLVIRLDTQDIEHCTNIICIGA